MKTDSDRKGGTVQRCHLVIWLCSVTKFRDLSVGIFHSGFSGSIFVFYKEACFHSFLYKGEKLGDRERDRRRVIGHIYRIETTNTTDQPSLPNKWGMYHTKIFEHQLCLQWQIIVSLTLHTEIASLVSMYLNNRKQELIRFLQTK